MSVILGYQIGNKIVMAADNRLSNADGKIISDTEEKIIIVNNHLAISFSGNKAVQVMFENLFKEKASTDSFYVEDILFQLETFYIAMKMNKEEYAQNIIKTSSCFIIAGKNKNYENVLYGVSFVAGKLSHSKTQMILFPPADVSMKDCSEIFVRNYHVDLAHCMEKTVKEISSLSNLVSETGNIWVYETDDVSNTLKQFS